MKKLILVVVGLPKNMKNEESSIEPLILKYIKTINDYFPISNRLTGLMKGLPQNWLSKQ